MLNERERAVQTERMRGLVTTADRLVWSKHWFPSQHRPDINFLLTKLIIASPKGESVHIHPDMSPFTRRESEKIGDEVLEQQRVKKITSYSPRTRQIRIGESHLDQPDGSLRRTFYHDLALDNFCRLRDILPADYSDTQRRNAIELLALAFPNRSIPSLEDTVIRKSGFKEMLTAEGYQVSMLGNFEAQEIVNEIYPTIFEMVTDQILRRGGDVFTFERDVRNRRVQLMDGEDHINFATTLFDVLRFIDWRDLLDAFGTGEIEESLKILFERERVQGVAAGIFMGLYEAMQQDEDLVFRLNSVFYDAHPHLRPS